MQNHYNLLYREEEREMFPTLKVSDYYFALRSRMNTHSGARCWASAPSHGRRLPRDCSPVRSPHRLLPSEARATRESTFLAYRVCKFDVPLHSSLEKYKSAATQPIVDRYVPFPREYPPCKLQ